MPGSILKNKNPFETLPGSPLHKVSPLTESPVNLGSGDFSGKSTLYFNVSPAFNVVRPLVLWSGTSRPR